jgi:putative ABC transport system substrate-binding protein
VFPTIDGDPVEDGLVASLARPGGNVTGFTGIAYDLAGKRLELLKDLVPKATCVGLLSAGPGVASGQLRGTEAVARKLGIQVQVLTARGPDELESITSSLRDNRPEALSVVGTLWINSHRERVIAFIEKHKLPAIYSNDSFVPIGGLMSYAADQAHQFGEAAGYVARILAGAKPTDLPVQQPTKFELVVNMKTAKALGITIPQSIMLRADRVIQ